jgi:hypothetical protein
MHIKPHDLFFYIFEPMPLFLFFNTQTMHIKSKVHNSIATTSPQKPYALAGFEPGPSVPEANGDVDFFPGFGEQQPG